MSDTSLFVIPNDTDVCFLNCKEAFEALTPKEKCYAYHLSKAIWNGSLIVLLQTSPESPGIYLLLRKVFAKQTVEKCPDGLTHEEWKAILVYASAVYSNSGNYKSFGDSKIIPNLPQDKFELFIKMSQAYKGDAKNIQGLWDTVKTRMYSLTKRQQQLGLGEANGITTYFSHNCDMKDAEICQEFMKEKNLSAYNTRLFKTKCNGKVAYEIRQASVDMAKGEEEKYGDVTFRVTRGDYSPLLRACIQSLEQAKECAANENQMSMLGEYINSFKTGSIPAHKEGSRYWIKDHGPIIESYIGFIESYRDPFGVRGEFEGFVAMVNKEMSAKFNKLVERSEEFLPLLPWPKEYEKDTFHRPDFTSLDVLTFGGSGIPAGINIPNYDDIRQEEGFKNVSLGNVLASGYKDTKVTFVSDTDVELLKKWKIPSFEVQVGLHELLGHGSGKLFMKNADGTFNFDKTKVKHTETGDNVSSWYEANETWDSQFSVISAPYEECRAECVGIYLCFDPEILKVFGYEGETAKDIVYVNWLNMVRAGVLALEFYSPESNKWRQAHMQGRYVILQILLEAGEGLVKVERTEGSDGKPDLLISLDRTKLESVGKPAIGKFLRKLQVYKATADFDNGKKMFGHYSAVNDDSEPRFLSMREIVLSRKQPRKMFVQCNTVLKGNSVELIEYEASPEGLIKSWNDRFQNGENDDVVEALWKDDAKYFD